MAHLVDPKLEQILEYCAEDPVERVFLEDVARRRIGRFAAVAGDDGRLVALCHTGANVVPSGRGCAAFGDAAARSKARMLIGEQHAVTELWEAIRGRLPQEREDRPGQPVFAIAEAPEPAGSGLRAATLDDLDLLVPACAAAHELELGVNPLGQDADGFRWRTRSQIEEGRSWLWADDGVVLFKAEASAWTPQAVQLQQVWTDPGARGRGHAARWASRSHPAAARARSVRLPVRARRERRGDPALRTRRHAACARLPQRAAVRELVLARHGESEYSLKQLVNGDPGIACPLTPAGREQARALGAALPDPDLVAVTEFERVRETADLALGDRDVPRLVVPELNDPRYGEFEGGGLDAYREWVWERGPLDAPVGGEHRGAIAARYAAGFRKLLERPEDTVLLVAHSLPIRYALDAAEGVSPRAKVGLVEYARPYTLTREQLARAVDVLEAWAAAPAF